MVNSEYGWATIDDIVRAYLGDIGEVTLHKYIWALHYVLEGWNNFEMDTSRTIKSVELPMSKTKNVKVPKDHIYTTKVGVKQGDRIFAFVRDSTVTTQRANDAEPNGSYRELLTKIAEFSYPDNFSLFLNNRGAYDIFGYVTGSNGLGYFREHQVPGGVNRIQFSSDVPGDSVVLEYVANNFIPSAKTAINMYASQLLKRWIAYKFAVRKYGEAHRETKECLRMFGYEIITVNGRQSDFSFDSYLDAQTRTFTLGPKI